MINIVLASGEVVNLEHVTHGICIHPDGKGVLFLRDEEEVRLTTAEWEAYRKLFCATFEQVEQNIQQRQQAENFARAQALKQGMAGQPRVLGRNGRG